MTTSQTKPMLLLDVDGVLNAFNPLRPHVVKRAQSGRTGKDGLPITYTLHFDQEIADMLDALAEHYEIHWATMWNHAANSKVAKMIGIDSLPVMTCSHDAGWDVLDAEGLSAWEIRGLWYAKTPLIPDYVGSRRFAWVDDDHSYRDRKYLGSKVSQDFFLLRTDAHDGLSWDDVDDLIAWAKGEYGDFDAWEDEVTQPIPAWDPEPVLVAGESTDQHDQHDPAFPDPLCRFCFAVGLDAED